MEYAFSKWYDAFWGKSNTKIVQVWPKADNITLFKTRRYIYIFEMSA